MTDTVPARAADDEQPAAPRPPGPRLPLLPTPWEVAGRFWRRLRRMSTALVLLFALAVATLIATFIPQEPVIASTVRLWRTGEEGPGAAVSGVLDALSLYDVFGSWWFGVLTVLLFVSLTGCLVPRWAAFARNVRKPPVRGRNLDRLTHRAELSLPPGMSESDVLDRAGRAFRTYRTRVITSEQHAPQLAIERGHWREFGSLVFHSSFYVLLIGVTLGAAFTFTGQIDFEEGARFADTPVGYDTFTAGTLWDTDRHNGHTTTLDAFEVTYLPDGFTPDDFVSTVTFTSADGERTVTEDIRVNHPVHFDGLTYYQRAFGFAPTVALRSGLNGAELFEDQLILRQDGGFWTGRGKVSVGNPAADPPLPQIAVEVLFLPDAEFAEDGTVQFNSPEANDPRLLVSLYLDDDLGLDRIVPISRLDWPESAVVDRAMIVPGTPVALAGGLFEVEFADLSMWSGLQISHQPYRWLILTGASMVLMGLIPSLYAYRRRLWVEVRSDRIVVAGVALHRRDRFAETFDDVVDRLAGTFGTDRIPAPSRFNPPSSPQIDPQGSHT